MPARSRRRGCRADSELINQLARQTSSGFCSRRRRRRTTQVRECSGRAWSTNPQYLADVEAQRRPHDGQARRVREGDATVRRESDDTEPRGAGDYDSQVAVLGRATRCPGVSQRSPRHSNENPHVLLGLTNEPHGTAGSRRRTSRPRSPGAAVDVPPMPRGRGRPSHPARRTTSSWCRRPRATRATSTYFLAHPLDGQ